MNMKTVIKKAKNVNYKKPALEMVEMETEGSLLLTASFTGDLGGGGNNQTPETENGGSLNGRSNRARIKR